MENIKLENIKQKIIFDDEYIKWMKEIAIVESKFANSSEFNSIVALDHGVQHMNRVAETVYKLMKEYGCSKNICYLGYISGLIHDIGMIYGKKDHAQNGSKMAKLFLKKLDFLNDSEIERVAVAIATHGNAENVGSTIGLFLSIADKIDMCKNRSLSKTSPICLINSLHANINQGTLEIYYEMVSPKGIEALYMIPKSIDIPQKVAIDLGLRVKFFINGKIENFIDRKHYKGEIYKRIDK